MRNRYPALRALAFALAVTFCFSLSAAPREPERGRGIVKVVKKIVRALGDLITTTIF